MKELSTPPDGTDCCAELTEHLGYDPDTSPQNLTEQPPKRGLGPLRANDGPQPIDSRATPWAVFETGTDQESQTRIDV